MVTSNSPFGIDDVLDNTLPFFARAVKADHWSIGRIAHGPRGSCRMTVDVALSAPKRVINLGFACVELSGVGTAVIDWVFPASDLTRKGGFKDLQDEYNLDWIDFAFSLLTVGLEQIAKTKPTPTDLNVAVLGYFNCQKFSNELIKPIMLNLLDIDNFVDLLLWLAPRFSISMQFPNVALIFDERILADPDKPEPTSGDPTAPAPPATPATPGGGVSEPPSRMDRFDGVRHELGSTTIEMRSRK